MSKSFEVEDDLRAIPKFNQTQRSLEEQLFDLALVANRIGLYDAADFLKNKLK